MARYGSHDRPCSKAGLLKKPLPGIVVVAVAGAEAIVVGVADAVAMTAVAVTALGLDPTWWARRMRGGGWLCVGVGALSFGVVPMHLWVLVLHGTQLRADDDAPMGN